MIDKITSVFDNYSGKIKNPFIGTIISVWLIHNWRIPFALFTFDKECTMIDKINFIADYFGKQNFWEEWINIIGISFLILIFTFILLGISRALTDIYYNVIESKIITKIDEKAIFTKDEKARLEKRISNLNNKIEIRDNEILKLESNITKISLEKTNEITILNEHIQKEKDNYEGVKTLLIPFISARTEFEKYFDNVSKETLRKLFTTDIHLRKIYIQNEDDVNFLTSNGIIYNKNQEIKTMDLALIHSINKKNQDFRLTKYGILFVNYLKQNNQNL